MKALGKIILYLLATVVLGALLAAPLYWGGQWLAGHGVLAWLAETSFRKFFHRGLLIAAILLLWPTARWLQVSSVRALGLAPNPHRFQDTAFGFSVAFLSMALLGVVLLATHIVKLRNHVHGADIATIAVSAVAVSILEEWLFRGAILGLLTRAMNSYLALFATSALFSILHFLKPNDAVVPQTVGWLSGFTLIPGAFAQFNEPWLVLGGFTTLFCVGWILGWARLKTRSLWLPIGLHAGWVFGMQTFAKATRREMTNTLPWFGENLLVGIGAILVVCLAGLLVGRYLRNRS